MFCCHPVLKLRMKSLASKLDFIDRIVMTPLTLQSFRRNIIKVDINSSNSANHKQATLKPENSNDVLLCCCHYFCSVAFHKMGKDCFNVKFAYCEVFWLTLTDIQFSSKAVTYGYAYSTNVFHACAWPFLHTFTLNYTSLQFMMHNTKIRCFFIAQYLL